MECCSIAFKAPVPTLILLVTVAMQNVLSQLADFR